MFEKISYTVLNKLNDTTDKKNSYSLFLIEHQRMRHITSEHLITVAVGYYFFSGRTAFNELASKK